MIDGCRNLVDLGVGIDDTSLTPGHHKTPSWGRFNARHRYSVRFTGRGARIRVDYHDCFYGDNRANLHQPGTGPLVVSVFAATS